MLKTKLKEKEELLGCLNDFITYKNLNNCSHLKALIALEDSFNMPYVVEALIDKNNKNRFYLVTILNYLHELDNKLPKKRVLKFDNEGAFIEFLDNTNN